MEKKDGEMEILGERERKIGRERARKREREGASSYTEPKLVCVSV